ncbi:MAG: hypothetical protein E7572_09570 [Ruminococcaceae bacterium]|nr:hypothetical protein [Oscillospiraceae bacterium]
METGKKPLHKRIAAWFRKTVPRIKAANPVPDVLAVSGAACASAGVYQIYVPAGWIVLGVMLIAGAVIWSRGGDAG